jgi:hypothetical protein
LLSPSQKIHATKKTTKSSKGHNTRNTNVQKILKSAIHSAVDVLSKKSFTFLLVLMVDEHLQGKVEPIFLGICISLSHEKS